VKVFPLPRVLLFLFLKMANWGEMGERSPTRKQKTKPDFASFLEKNTGRVQKSGSFFEPGPF
jgi:hypothetical protein